MWRLSDFQTRSELILQETIEKLSPNHRNIADRLKKLQMDLQELHQEARHEIDDCQRNHHFIAVESPRTGGLPTSTFIPELNLPSSPTLAAAKVRRSTNSKQSIVGTAPTPARERRSSFVKMLRFNRSEIIFVRKHKETKTPPTEIYKKMLEEFPRWINVDQERLLAKIRRVRKRKGDDEGDDDLSGAEGNTDDDVTQAAEDGGGDNHKRHEMDADMEDEADTEE